MYYVKLYVVSFRGIFAAFDSQNMNKADVIKISS